MEVPDFYAREEDLMEEFDVISDRMDVGDRTLDDQIKDFKRSLQLAVNLCQIVKSDIIRIELKERFETQQSRLPSPPENNFSGASASRTPPPPPPSSPSPSASPSGSDFPNQEVRINRCKPGYSRSQKEKLGLLHSAAMCQKKTRPTNLAKIFAKR